MKKAVILLMVCSFLISGYAQSDSLSILKFKRQKNINLEFSLGYSITLGDYKEFDKKNNKSGYADNGWLAQLTLDWLGKRDIGLAFQYTFQRNPLLDTARNINPYGTGDSSFRLGSGAWSNNYLMAGPVYLHYFKRISLDFRILLGIILVTSSNFSITDPATKQTSSYTATGFAYQFSGGVGYKISNHLAVKINTSFMGANPTVSKEFYYATLEERIDEHGNKYYVTVFQGSEITIKKVVSTLNIGIGVIYKF